MPKNTLRLVMIVDSDPISSFVTKLMCLSTHFASSTLIMNSKEEAIKYLSTSESNIHPNPDAIIISCNSLKNEKQNCETCVNDFLQFADATSIVLVCGEENEMEHFTTPNNIFQCTAPIKECDFTNLKGRLKLDNKQPNFQY